MTSSWSLVTFRNAARPREQAGVLRDDGRVVVPGSLQRYAGLMELMRDWDSVSAGLRELQPARLQPLTDAVVLAPLRFPNKLICAGANYHAHIREMGGGPPPPGWRPFFFFLPPTTTLIGPDEVVEISDEVNTRPDWEAELAVVIGRRASRVSVADASNYVAGYACFNDITARGLLKREVALAPPFSFDWASCKGRDTFCPMGPITPHWQVPDPHVLGVRCSVNGVEKQNGRTSDLVSNLWELISEASHNWTLEPGDVIATGTPAGVGAARGEFLKPGDHILVQIDGLSSLANRVVQRREHTVRDVA